MQRHLPDMTPPVGPYQSRIMLYHDNTRRVVYWSDREVPYPDGRLIVSRTDLSGIITHANEAFVELSGYSNDDLIGAPHHILRHPDMPRMAFKDLWDTITSGRKWHGYVKNLRKDGAYYWVYATALPNIRGGRVAGFTSVRRKPSRRRVDELIPLYRQWLEDESGSEHSGELP